MGVFGVPSCGPVGPAPGVRSVTNLPIRVIKAAVCLIKAVLHAVQAAVRVVQAAFFALNAAFCAVQAALRAVQAALRAVNAALRAVNAPGRACPVRDGSAGAPLPRPPRRRGGGSHTRRGAPRLSGTPLARQPGPPVLAPGAEPAHGVGAASHRQQRQTAVDRDGRHGGAAAGEAGGLEQGGEEREE